MYDGANCTAEILLGDRIGVVSMRVTWIGEGSWSPSCWQCTIVGDLKKPDSKEFGTISVGIGLPIISRLHIPGHYHILSWFIRWSRDVTDNLLDTQGMHSTKRVINVTDPKNICRWSPGRCESISFFCTSLNSGTGLGPSRVHPTSKRCFNRTPKLGAYKTGDSSLYSLIGFFASSGDLPSLDRLLDQMKLEHRPLLERSFINIFKAYGRAHMHEKAIDLFERMVDDFCCKRTVRSFNSVLNIIIQNGSYHRALDFYSYGTRNSMNICPNVLSFNLAIKAACKLEEIDRAIQLFREMPARSCVPDIFTYSTLMDGLCKEGRVDEAICLLDEMQIEGCFPNSVAYNVLINGLCKKGEIRRALKLVNNMFLKGCFPNETTYNTLICGLCLKGMLPKAIELLNLMVVNNCAPNSVTYATIVNGLVKQGRSLDGVDVIKFMEKRGFGGNQYAYSALLSGLFKEKKFEEARKFWKDMTEEGIILNEVIYSALIDGLCREGKLEEAEEALVDMINKGFTPNAFTYSSFLRGLFSIGSTQKALLMWEKMESKYDMKNEVCYSVLIDGLCRAGKLEEALIFWKEFLAKGFSPDVITYSSMINGLCNNDAVDQGLELFNEMLYRGSGCQPDVITYNILFNALCRRGDISYAVDLLNGMLNKGCDPDWTTCNIFLKALREKVTPPLDGSRFLNELVFRLFSNEKVKGASEILDLMLQKFLLPEITTWHVAVQQLCKPKKIRAAIDKAWNDLIC